MRILIATDAFKDALSAPEVCSAIARGIRRAMPDAELHSFPMADGGEGTAQVLTMQSSGQAIHYTVHDPLFRSISATYGLSGDGQTAFIEMAQASGLQRLKTEERNPLLTSTFGTGELIADALQRGVRKIVLAIGGSATNDAGMGMAAALGYQFQDAHGQTVQLVGGKLGSVAQVVNPAQNPLQNVAVEVLCDVDNPLYGKDGAAQVYARQKGADDAAIALLDRGLQHFSEVLRAHFGKDFAHLRGAGAAGGLGAGAMAFLNAQLRPGIEAVMQYTNFEEALQGVDLIVTGEGKIDRQTLHGKVISGIAKQAAARGIPVIAFCGTLEATASEIQQIGLRAAFSILSKPLNLAEAIPRTAEDLEQSAFNIFSVYNL